jgi:L-rhamnose-H+ transport protein
LWGSFKVVGVGKNISLTGLMAILNFTASILFAYSAFVLGKAGGTIGYAIFNTMSVVVAVVGGILTKEWISAKPAAKSSLYIGLVSMIIGVVIIAIGNSLA